MSDDQIQLDFAGAPERIRALLAAQGVGRSGRHGHRVVGITGPVGAGKSHLARAIAGTIVATDDYLPDYDVTPEARRDLPESSDLERLARDLAALSSGVPVKIPTWSFQEHRRTGEREVTPMGVIVCEGLHALHERVGAALDLCVFVEAPADIRRARAEARERAGERGWGVEYFRHFFRTVAEPTFARFAGEYRARAHVIVNNAKGG